MKKIIFILFLILIICIFACACEDIYEIPVNHTVSVNVCGEKICSVEAYESNLNGFKLNESEEKKMIEVVDIDGNKIEVELVTYLVSEDGNQQYLVYSKGEVRGAEGDQIIYISKLFGQNGILRLEEIVDDNEWLAVQRLLKKIANAE